MGKIQDVDKFYADLGENIKTYRTKRGYSQDELAKFLDLTRTSVVNIEKGRQRPPLHTVYDLAAFFNIGIIDLLPAKDEKQQIDLRKSVKDSINTIEKKFKDVPIDEEKLTLFFKLSSQG